MIVNEPKQVIVVRTDLNMRKGKIAAQVAHASLGAILNYAHQLFEGEIKINVEHEAVREWLSGRFKKICVGVASEAELLEIFNAAHAAGINVKLIRDAGLTEFGGVPTLTCLALGPDWPDKIVAISGHLRLL